MLLDDLSGKTFGIWKVLALHHMAHYGGNGKHGCSYYSCECTECGQIFVVSRNQLLQAVNVRHHGKCKED